MLFFNASPLPPSGATNPWPLQTGSMRVRRQTCIVCFLFLGFFFAFPYSRSLSFSLSITLPPPLTLPCWKTFNLKPSSHQLQSTLLCGIYSPALDTTLPPISSAPPLSLAHLVLSVKLPITVSHALIPSSCCDLHLWGPCSCQCSAHDVTTCFDHPVCLVSVSHCPFLLMFVQL